MNKIRLINEKLSFSKMKFILFVSFLIGFVACHPWDPVPRTDEGWVKKHKAFLDSTKKHANEIHLLFYGDSITEGWGGAGWGGSGKNVWKQYYGNLHAYDYGIGGDKTENLVYRIESGEVANLHPKVVVLMIGTNNLAQDSVEDISKGVKAVVDLLHSKLPNSKILLLAILPRNTYNDKVKQLNALISKFANGNSVTFLSMNNHFEDAKGIHSDLYVEGLHLNEKGYKVWAQTMDPTLKKLLGN